MKHYSEEIKAAVLAKMMRPRNLSVPALSEETWISLQTLYNWCQKDKLGDRGQVIDLIHEAVAAGARKSKTLRDIGD